jgi:hypothetical protein
MKPKTEKIVQPLKKLKASKQRNEEAQLLLKPAVRIQERKNKLIIHGNELFQTKKINEALFWKIKMLTYSITIEEKIKNSYSTLESIDNDVELAESTQTKPKTKTIKDFKGKKENDDADKNALYNIYVKFKASYIIDFKSKRPNYQLFEHEDWKSDIHRLWEIKQFTLQAYGKNKIIDEIQSFLESALSNPYTHKN